MAQPEIKKMRQGMSYTGKEKTIIMNVFKYFNQIHPDKCVTEIVRQTAKATGCSEKSIFQFRKEEKTGSFKEPSKTKIRKNININSRDCKYNENVRDSLRRIIYSLKLKNVRPSLPVILKQAKDDPDLPRFSLMTCRRLLFDMGFYYEKVGNKSILVEKESGAVENKKKIKKKVKHKDSSTRNTYSERKVSTENKQVCNKRESNSYAGECKRFLHENKQTMLGTSVNNQNDIGNGQSGKENKDNGSKIGKENNISGNQVSGNQISRNQIRENQINENQISENQINRNLISVGNRAGVDDQQISHSFDDKQAHRVTGNQVYVENQQLQLPYNSEVNSMSNKRYVEEDKRNFVGNKQNSTDIKQNYIENKQNYIGNKQSYSESKQNYAEPKQNYVESKQNYVESKQNYVENKQNYIENKQHYVENKHNYLEIKNNYPENKLNYAENKHNYERNKQSYLDNKQNYLENRQNYLDNKQNYLDNKHNYLEPKEPYTILENKQNSYMILNKPIPFHNQVPYSNKQNLAYENLLIPTIYNDPASITIHSQHRIIANHEDPRVVPLHMSQQDPMYISSVPPGHNIAMMVNERKDYGQVHHPLPQNLDLHFKYDVGSWVHSNPHSMVKQQ